MTAERENSLGSNPFAALVFFWPELERQVRIEGKVTRTLRKVSDEYFNARPEGSRIGSWASPQSQRIPSREYLENLQQDYAEALSAKKAGTSRKLGRIQADTPICLNSGRAVKTAYTTGLNIPGTEICGKFTGWRPDHTLSGSPHPDRVGNFISSKGQCVLRWF